MQCHRSIYGTTHRDHITILSQPYIITITVGVNAKSSHMIDSRDKVFSWRFSFCILITYVTKRGAYVEHWTKGFCWMKIFERHCSFWCHWFYTSFLIFSHFFFRFFSFLFPFFLIFSIFSIVALFDAIAHIYSQ